MPKKKTTEEFIRDARKKHGDKYDYSKVVYQGSAKNVMIICPMHGEFPQTPHMHLSGQGCPTCGGHEKKTKEQFLRQANEIHGDKYEYDKVVYKGNTTNVLITCPIHGDFPQTPKNHIRGSGCPECGKERRALKKRKTKEQFIQEATKIHGNKFDYSNILYINNSTNIQIKCNKCGKIFPQTPINHLQGKGCIYCCGHNTMTNEEFIAKARRIHQGKYEYNKVNIISHEKPVEIFCKECDEYFPQTPYIHLQGCGCPNCGKKTISKKLSSNTNEFVKKMNQRFPNLYDLTQVEYINNTKPITVYCNTCGSKLSKTPQNLLSGRGCPVCNESHLERDIRGVLVQQKMPFIPQYHPRWMGLQSLDFGLTKQNVAIECQGEQHFQEVEHFGGEINLKKTISRDHLKYRKCKDNGVRLIYVSSRKFKVNYQDEMYGGIYNDDNLLFIEDIMENNDVLTNKIKG